MYIVRVLSSSSTENAVSFPVVSLSTPGRSLLSKWQGRKGPGKNMAVIIPAINLFEGLIGKSLVKMLVGCKCCHFLLDVAIHLKVEFFSQDLFRR